jgi:signal transduction histidine kinase/ligand-binding sensor domain-containing protein/DNA-binding response OmpR family regulator
MVQRLIRRADFIALRALAIFTFLVAFFNAPAQSPTLVDFIGANDGFSESSVYAMLCDKKGFMWHGTADGLWQYDGYRHTVYRNDPADSTTLSNNFIRNIFEDRDGNIWTCTLGGGINLLNPATGKFTRYIKTPAGTKKFPGKENTAITQDAEGNIWIASSAGLEKFNLKTGAASTWPYNKKEPNSLNGDAIGSLMFDHTGKLYVCYLGDGFDILDVSNGTIKHFSNKHPDPTLDIRSNVIRSVIEDKSGVIWLGTYGGLLRFDPSTEKISHFIHDEKDPGSLTHNSIWNLTLAPDNKLWIATFGGGLSKLNLANGRFENEDYLPEGVYGIESRELTSIFLDKTNTLWVGTNGNGIYKINPIPGLQVLKNTEELSTIKMRGIARSRRYMFFLTEAEGLYVYEPSGQHLFRIHEGTGLSSNQVVSASEDPDGNIWIGTNNGLGFYDARTRIVKSFRNNPDDNKSLAHNSVLCTFVDSQGGVWIGHAFGLAKWNPLQKSFQKINISSATNQIYRILETTNGLWLGSTRNGLYLLNKDNVVTESFSHNDENEKSISSNYVTALFEDSRHILWVGTNQGLNSYNSDGTFTRYRKLPDHRVGSIAEDVDHNIVVHIEEALYRIVPGENPGITRVSNPLQTMNVDWHVSPVDNSIYLVAGKNVARFYRDAVQSNRHIPPVVITQFRLYSNTKHKFPLSDTTFSSSYLERVSLPYEENVFSVEFAALDFHNPKANQYAYMLEGFDNDWIYCGTRRFITYTNLDPGDYTLRVKGSNSDGVWNDEGTSLSLRIAPPFYRTWWAYMTYFLALVGLLLWGLRAVVNRERLLAQVAIEKKENQTLQELDTLKNKFFANITHEFRTPLTLIQGPTDRLMEKASDGESRQLLNLIRNNSTRLLSLINQLLDFARFDAREMKLNIAPVRTTVFLRTIIAQFSSHASSKNIQLITTLPENLPQLNTDGEKIETILSNLISNALKFTPSGGAVEVRASWKTGILQMVVKDSGRGIPHEKIKFIFDRFYQVESAIGDYTEGTGIGLALVKEYIGLLKGTIEVESEVGKGTTFSVSIPAALANADDGIEKSTAEVLPIDLEEGSGDSLQPLLLLVEDNEDLRFFIRNCLGGQYNYLEAKNGREGLALARHHVPDLIVSDLMMPEMDGIALCAAIRKDKRTDHIPFVMLTAKAGDESKIEGLRSGADDYLIKPFNKTELVLKIQNLIILRERLQMSIKNRLLSKSDQIEVTSLEDQFILKVRNFIEQHLADETLTVEKLASEVGLSREQCYRKILAISGLSPSALIRSLRLQRAGQLLASRWGPVSQVAYEVGFSNLSHFSKAFREEFGKLPSEYARQDQDFRKTSDA